MRRFLSPGWLLGHLTALVLVAACLALGWWQIRRAGEGSMRSYAYAVEWPVFAAFVVFVWFREVRRARSEVNASPPEAVPQPASVSSLPDGDTAPSPPPVAAGPEDELAAYNRMLAWINANPHRRMTDYPG